MSPSVLVCANSIMIYNLLSTSQVEVQDTVGCGDSFASAIVLGFINGHSTTSTLALANAVGAATATRRGAGRNVADAPLVRRLLRQASGDRPAADEPNAQALEILERSLAGRSSPGL